MMNVRRISSRILSVDLVLFETVIIVISVYGPQIDRSAKDKNRFYDNLSAEMQSKNRNCISLKDFNGHVKSLINECERVHGEHEWRIRHKDGKRV